MARRRPCYSCGAAAPSEAHHVTYGRGFGQKAPDSDVIPLCVYCHLHFHRASGPFNGWTKRRRRDWQRDALQELWRGEGTF
jgi:hypothetical protein